MGVPILDANAPIFCPHGGRAMIATSNVRVRAAGGFALLATDVMPITGCPFRDAESVPSPCVKVQWMLPAMRVVVNGSPVLLESSVGLCLNAASAPQGTAIVATTQTRVMGR